ncbi:hypothetical protein ACR9GW_01130 [Enterobacter ludwigii]
MSNKHHDLLGVSKHANQHRLSRLTMEVHTDELRIMASAVESYTDELIAALEDAEKRIAELEARTLVPVEPTLDQLVAGKRRLTSTGRMSRLMSQRLAEVYRAMVNAAAAGKGEVS